MRTKKAHLYSSMSQRSIISEFQLPSLNNLILNLVSRSHQKIKTHDLPSKKNKKFTKCHSLAKAPPNLKYTIENVTMTKKGTFLFFYVPEEHYIQISAPQLEYPGNMVLQLLSQYHIPKRLEIEKVNFKCSFQKPIEAQKSCFVLKKN